MSEPTNPAHYTRLSPEPIAVIESWGLDFHLGNALKYIARAGHKDGSTAHVDLAKARWYIDRALSQCDEPLTVEEAIDSLTVELEQIRGEVKRGEVVQRAAGDRIRELQKQLVDAGLGELAKNAPAEHMEPDAPTPRWSLATCPCRQGNGMCYRCYYTRRAAGEQV